MEIQGWANYCGLAVIGRCFGQRYERPNQIEQDVVRTEQPVILDTAHMGKFN